MRMRIPFVAQTFTWAFLDQAQAHAQAHAWRLRHADSLEGSLHGLGGVGGGVGAAGLDGGNGGGAGAGAGAGRTEGAREGAPAGGGARPPPPPLPLDPIAELVFYAIDGDVVLWPDGEREVLISVQNLLLLDRYTPSSPCRRCIESVRAPPQPPSSSSSTAAGAAATADAATAAGSAASAFASTDGGGGGGAADTAPFAQLRVDVRPKGKSGDDNGRASQEIGVWISRLHMVVTAPLMARLYDWVVDGWGDAHVYGYYLLTWIYRYRRMVKVAVLAAPQLTTTGSSDCI